MQHNQANYDLRGYLKTKGDSNDEHHIESNFVDRVPEIKDIYDHIYGNVQSKLEFYENKRTKRDSNSEDVTEKTSTIYIDRPCSLNITNLENISIKDNSPPLPTTPKTPTFTKLDLPFVPSEDSQTLKSKFQTNPDLLRDCKTQCSKCEKLDFINDRSEVLTEINLNLKLELDSVKNDYKKEVAKNSELNFEIANIEAALESYCNEAKNQKSTLSAIYSTMKDTLKQKNESRDNYTFKRVKIIADYIETLKGKLEHQDRIIKNNFKENPYHTDLIMRHDAARKQLDDLSKINEQLKIEIKQKSQEELDTIKELNRQKFQIESKCKEIESYYKNELLAKEIVIRNLEDEHKKQVQEINVIMAQKEEDMMKAQKVLEAKISNYKQELVVIYRKMKQTKTINQINP